ncbi:MAG TPA: signal recognition particle-docking protein FtsY [Candidatus Eisenbacteria bacterium]|nr:signal recognition particle-docking protein FtsY [Candidatus Eisenbacteria bacterium]
MGFLDRFSQGLKKTREAVMGQAASVLRPGHKLTEEDFEKLEEALLRADVGPAATDRVLEGVRRRLAKPGAENDPAAAVREEIENLFAGAAATGAKAGVTGAAAGAGAATGTAAGATTGATAGGTGGAKSTPGPDAPTETAEEPKKRSWWPGFGKPQAPPEPAKPEPPAVAAPTPPAAPSPRAPHVILIVGVNGTGKTTTIAKLAHHYKKEGERVLLVACDTFRAAASDQLQIWADRVGVEIHRQKEGADPAAVAFDGMARAKNIGATRVLVDTAGRLHVKANLMAELEKVRRVIDRAIPGAPHETLLVLDATTGQNGLAQVREFGKALPMTGLVLTKLDGTAKGGVALAIAESLKLPLQWVGLGEGMEDLIPFDAKEFAEALIAQ